MSKGCRSGCGKWIALAALVLVVAAGFATWLGVRFVQEPLQFLADARRSALEDAGFAEREIAGDQGDLRLVVLEAGEAGEAGDGPVLVFFHGLGDQAGGWADVAPHFSDRYLVVAVDLPGHGASEPADGPLTMDEIVAGAERVLDDVTQDGPAILVGNSLGGWLSQILALRRPERVERIVVVNGGGVTGRTDAPSLVPADREEARALMAMLRDPSSDRVPDFVLDDLVERSAAGPIGRLSADVEGLTAHLLDGRLGELRVPVDLVWGPSDQLLDLDYARRMESEIPASRMTVLEACGHVPQIECPDQLVAALDEVLGSPPPQALVLEIASDEAADSTGEQISSEDWEDDE